MNCKNVQNTLNDYIDGTCSNSETLEVEAHCHSCDTCLAELESLQNIRNTLIDLPIPPPTDDFEKRVIASAIKEAQVVSHKPLIRRLYPYAAAAMISVVVIFMGLFDEPANTEDAPYIFSVGNDVRTLKVAIDSEQAIDLVRLRVEISGNLELAGYGNKKQISWTTNLREGANVISLPIIGIAHGTGDIRAHVFLNGKEKIMHIQTQYKVPDSVLFQNSETLQG
ncbi:hypothetical protein MNBD_GAMMA05-2600 [hydrothermal vent metagenome]|uniref:Putative zinc-finger domain-containing protein n=1 Tax=hydrothermal vent metagenome TaxID=652676 RepID=A0A3B0WH86_9ZZZZ